MQRDMFATALTRVVSGGQTGVDRGALDAALAAGLSCGGYCPKGRRAEDGRIPDRYPLQELDSGAYRDRTEQNVLESDGTLILCRDRPMGGTGLTQRLASQSNKPCLVLRLPTASEAKLNAWLVEHSIRVLNVAGPRESQSPGIQKEAASFLLPIFRVHAGTEAARTAAK